MAVSLAPNDAYYRFRMGDLCLKLGWVKEAGTELMMATQLAPYDSYYLIRYGFVSLALGRIVEAIDALRSALRMEPWNRCYRVMLADAYAEAGMESEAAKLNSEAGELDSYDMEFVGRRRMELNRAEMDAGG